MLFPITQTQPAELMGTHLAGHVVTPLVLLDGLLTGWTCLRVRKDPSYIFTFIGVLLIP